jgi:hypothetical protein
MPHSTHPPTHPNRPRSAAECSKISQRERKAACEVGYQAAAVEGCLQGAKLAIEVEHTEVEEEEEVEEVIVYEDAVEAQAGEQATGPSGSEL